MPWNGCRVQVLPAQLVVVRVVEDAVVVLLRDPPSLGKVAGAHQCGWDGIELVGWRPCAMVSVVGDKEKQLFPGKWNLATDGRRQFVLVLNGLGSRNGLARRILGRERPWR